MYSCKKNEHTISLRFNNKSNFEIDSIQIQEDINKNMVYKKVIIPNSTSEVILKLKNVPKGEGVLSLKIFTNGKVLNTPYVTYDWGKFISKNVEFDIYEDDITNVSKEIKK